MYQGDVGAYNNQGEEIASMDNVSFVIMNKLQDWICDGPLDGILGVSYSEGNDVNRIPSSGFDISNLWDESCVIDGNSIGNCNTENQTTLPAPLEAALAQDVESGYNKAEVFGLYLDYAATIGSKADTVVPSLGAYFGGDLALNNQFYNGGNIQTASRSPITVKKDP